MGLYMYAYAINKDVVENEPEFDVPLYELIYRKYGVYELSKERGSSEITQDQRHAIQETLNDAKEKAISELGYDSDFAYWRKFNHLHGWMERLYIEKGGQEEFNCTTVRLNPEDIDRLEEDMINGNLTPTAGFFFGGDQLYPEDLEDLKIFIQKCRNAFEMGKAVFYDSWW